MTFNPTVNSDFSMAIRSGSNRHVQHFLLSMGDEMELVGFSPIQFQRGVGTYHPVATEIPHHHEEPSRYENMAFYHQLAKYWPVKEIQLAPEVHWTRKDLTRDMKEIHQIMERGYNAYSFLIEDLYGFHVKVFNEDLTDEERTTAQTAFNTLIGKVNYRNTHTKMLEELRARYPRVTALHNLTNAPLPKLKDALQERLADYAEERIAFMLGNPPIATASGEVRMRDEVVRKARETGLQIQRATTSADCWTAYNAAVTDIDSQRIAGAPQFKYVAPSGARVSVTTPEWIAPQAQSTDTTISPIVIEALTLPAEIGVPRTAPNTIVEQATSNSEDLTVTVARGSSQGVDRVTLQWLRRPTTNASVYIQARNASGVAEASITVPILET